MARYGRLTVMAVCAALANLGLSIVLVRRLGLTGVALETLLPTATARLFFVFPYVLRVMGVGVREAIREMILPAMAPAVPMALTILVLREIVRPSTLPAVGLVAGLGGLVYVTGYLAVGARKAERLTSRRLAQVAARWVFRRFRSSPT